MTVKTVAFILLALYFSFGLTLGIKNEKNADKTQFCLNDSSWTGSANKKKKKIKKRIALVKKGGCVWILFKISFL